MGTAILTHFLVAAVSPFNYFMVLFKLNTVVKCHLTKTEISFISKCEHEDH